MQIESSHKLPKSLRVHNKSIMDRLITCEKYDIEELLQVNACRIYLQVISLADICEGDGHQILEHFLEGIQETTRISKWKWPYLPRPPTR